MAIVTLSESVREYTEGDVRMLIGDEWTGALSGETFPVFDPATGAEIARAPRGGAADACDSALPFGGYKESGWGRETCKETLDEYTELKTVVVSLGAAT